MKKYKKRSNKNLTPSVNSETGNPETVFEMVNRYGTYEIQATADTENQYPAIAQGYNEKIKRNDGENKNRAGK